MRYIENHMEAALWRQGYRDGIERLIEERYKQARVERSAQWTDFPTGIDEKRAFAKEILGWPLTEGRGGVPEVKKELLAEEENFSLYRTTVEALPGMPFYGLLFLQKGTPVRPLILSLHGKEGTPELCSSLLGSSTNYNEMTQRLLKTGAHVYAPQTLLWNTDMFGVPYNRERVDARLKHLGGSVVALEAHCLMRSIDALSGLDCVDAENIGVCGLSYGGFYSLLLAALDPWVRSTVACARFTDLDFDIGRIVNEGDAQISWKGAAFSFTQVEMAMLCYPRRLRISMAMGDQIVSYSLAEKAMTELAPRIASTAGEGWFEFLPFEGDHEFCPDDGPIRALAADLGL